MKFETINGTLCIMTEPVPLTAEAKVPCVVQFNPSDHRTINFRNRKPFILHNINNEGYVHYELAYAAHYSLFEILGYPVVEGSKEWALYQMMQGESISINDQPARCLKLSGDRIQDSNKDGHWEGKSGNEFLSYAASTGWQIHEPKPEPKYKVGDWVETNDGIHGVVVEPNNNAIVNIIPTNHRAYQVGRKKSNITRKLDPSEVVVNFGGGIKGTIVGCSNVMPIVKVLSGVDWIASIMVSALDAQARELVESLLKAQEEK